jgi:hypothetical protein
MKKNNFIRVAAFITAFTFISAQSAYGPSVYALQKMDDEQLADVEAAALNMDMNLTVRAVAGGGAITAMSLNHPTNGDSLNIGYIALGGSAGVGSSRINTTMSWDIGPSASTGQVWLLGTNITFPAAGNTLGLLAQNIFVRDNNGTAQYLGNVTLSGIVFGKSVYPAGGPNLTPNFGVSPQITTPWVIISNHGGTDPGFRFFGEIAAYIDNVRLQYRGSADAQSVRVSGIYLYGMMNQTITNAVAGGATDTLNKTGAVRIGGTMPLYPNAYSPAASGTIETYATIDAGNSGGNTVLGMNLPMLGSIRVKNFSINSTSFGPFALEDVVLYRNAVTIRSNL